MLISRAQIYNITLNILGISMPLENVNSSDNKAILLNNYYELAKNFVLKDFDWNFASTYKALSLCDSENITGEYTYCYDYPNDCVCARQVLDNFKFDTHKFLVSSTSQGSTAILTNCKNAILRYTRNVDKEVYFSCEFSMALAYYLASLTSNVLSGSIQKGELAFEKYKALLSRAKLLNAREGEDIEFDDKTYIDARS